MYNHEFLSDTTILKTHDATEVEQVFYVKDIEGAETVCAEIVEGVAWFEDHVVDGEWHYFCVLFLN